VKARILIFLTGIGLPVLFLSISSCKKINDATAMGNGLIPSVDNITTFDTTLDVETFNDVFTILNDSTRLPGGAVHFLGNITNDPLFGASSGTIFTQLKPSGYKFYFPFSSPDSLLGLDSVVLVLGYNGTLGDTALQQSVKVYEMDQSDVFRHDSAYMIRQNNFTYSNLLGNATYTPMNLKDSVHLYKDSGSNQLRIPLNSAFGMRLLTYDSSGAYSSDSSFNTYFKGFAIVPGGTGNALIGINLAASKLAIYYRYKNKGLIDTTVTNFTFTSASASANYIQRNYTGSEFAGYQGSSTPSDKVFIQGTPGSFARIKIPGLAGLGNRVIHLAELQVQEIYDPSNAIFESPTNLYLDAYDSAKSYYIAIPYDVATPDPTSASVVVSNPGFGFKGKAYTDMSGKVVTKWRFNISRYVQHIVNGTTKSHDLRLYSPYFARNYFRISGADYFYLPYVNSMIVDGRARVYGGAPSTNPERMRLRIVYSKL
jgi:hypothetical protein